MNNEQLNNEEFRQAMANLENNQGVDEADARIIIDTFKQLWKPEPCGDCDPCVGGRKDQCVMFPASHTEEIGLLRKRLLDEPKCQDCGSSLCVIAGGGDEETLGCRLCAERKARAHVESVLAEEREKNAVLQSQVQRLREVVELSIVRLKECRRFLPSHGTYAEDQINAHESAVTKLERALSQTPEATDEGKDKARLDWLEKNSKLVGEEILGLPNMTWTDTLRREIDRAMASKTEGRDV